MGLLDLFGTSIDDPRTAATLAAAQGLLSGRGARGLVNGMAGYTGTMAAQKEAERQRAAQEQERALKQLLIDAQISEVKAQAGQRQAQTEEMQRKAAEAQRIQRLIQGAVMPIGGADANAASGVTGPRPEALQAVGQRPQINYQQLIAQGVPAELAKSLADSANYGRSKVARTAEGKDANGRPATFQLDEYGQRVGDAIEQWKAPEKVDTGGAVQMLDPVTLKAIATLNKTNTPDALLSASTTRRGQDMTDARSKEKNQNDAAAAGKVEWKQDVNGNWIALPKEVSGPGPVVPIATTAPGKREQQARNALDIIGEAKKLIDTGTSSYLGAGVDMAGKVFGLSSKGADAAAELKALEGALMMAQPRMEGPQSDKDTALYRQMAGQIGDPTVPVSQKKAAISRIESLHSKYAGLSPAAASAPKSAGIDDLVNKYRSR